MKKTNLWQNIQADKWCEIKIKKKIYRIQFKPAMDKLNGLFKKKDNIQKKMEVKTKKSCE